MEENPMVKQLMKLKWWQVRVKATELGIHYYKKVNNNTRKKTKKEMALEIAKKSEELQTRAWRTISNGHN